EVATKPSSYLTIEREWQDGDTVTIRLPMELRLEALPHSDEKILAVLFGPNLLAAVVPDEPGITNPSKIRFSEHLDSRGKTDAFPPLFVASGGVEVLAGLKPSGRAFGEFRSEGVVKPADLTFVPFHRVYEEQYAVYFPILTADEWVEREGGIRAEREEQLRLEAATIDSITPGYQQPEVEHAFRSEGSEIEDFSDRKGRFARDGGWFSYEVRCDPAEPLVLLVTYWGGVWHKRVFDLLLDDEPLATQSLLTDRPGDFFEKVYDLPVERTRDRAKLTLRFQSRPGDTAGSVFGIRVMKASAEPTRYEAGFVFKDH
ncbi:MAG: glycoside hydrolase family 127 protein, partial [Verrucomicrobiae bacterium]|nr:glycoside hydrolase family 127 protein [Verrucomicrobiae bacterium]